MISNISCLFVLSICSKVLFVGLLKKWKKWIPLATIFCPPDWFIHVSSFWVSNDFLNLFIPFWVCDVLIRNPFKTLSALLQLEFKDKFHYAFKIFRFLILIPLFLFLFLMFYSDLLPFFLWADSCISLLGQFGCWFVDNCNTAYSS